MGTELQEGTEVEEHLHEALERAENSETKYHIREALQKLYIEHY